MCFPRTVVAHSLGKKILIANYEIINKWPLKDTQFSMHLVYFPSLVPQLPDQGQ